MTPHTNGSYRYRSSRTALEKCEILCRLGKSSGVASDGTEAEKKWRTWVNERYVRIITANIYRSFGESWETFDYIVKHGNFGTVSRLMTRMFGTTAMYVIGTRMPKKYSIEGDLREALYAATDEWIEALEGKDFMGGKRPNLADLSVYGVIQAVEGSCCGRRLSVETVRFLLGTSTYKDVMQRTKIQPWLHRMAEEVGQTCRTNPAKSETVLKSEL